MKLDIKTVSKITMVAVAAAGMLFATAARACGVLPGSGLSLSRLSSPLSQLQALSALLGGQAREDSSEHRRASLVGMWTVNFYVADQLWDVAIEQFYGDGNEMTNDIAFPPSLGNICWGVWQQVSNRVYKMKHIGWTFDTNGAYAGRFDFAATVELSRDGGTFTGSFVADQEDLSGNIIPDLHAEGALQGGRFKI